MYKTWLLRVLAVSAITFVIINAIRIRNKYIKKKQSSTLDFYSVLKETCSEVLPRPLLWSVLTEISIFYYGFIYWKKRTLIKNEYSYHKESGIVTLLLAIILIIGIETFVLHAALIEWNSTFTWILTGLSVYSGLQFFGFLKSITKRPIFVDTNTKKIHLKYGIMSESIIGFEEIEAIEISTREMEFGGETRKLSIFGNLESHNVIITLKNINTLDRLYGMQKEFNVLALHVDNKNEFKNSIEEFTNSTMDTY